MTTPYMNLNLPDPQVTPGPTWAQALNVAMNLIDAHDHSSGKGITITQNSLNITGSINYNSNAGVGLTFLAFTNGTTNPAYNASIYFKSNELFVKDNVGNVIQLTSNGAINVSGLGGISGMQNTTAAVTYSDSLKTFIFTQAPGVAAKLNVSDIAASSLVSTGAISGTNGTFTGPVSGTTGTFSSSASCTSLGCSSITCSGAMSCTTLTGNVSGNLTGNVTGNCSGSSGSCTGNAATSTVASSCSGNAATATTASSCSGNAATATTASSCSGNSATASAISGLTISSGSWSPSISGLSNATHVTNANCYYQRIGNIVYCQGQVIIHRSAAGACAVQISLPVAKNNNFGDGRNINGHFRYDQLVGGTYAPTGLQYLYSCYANRVSGAKTLSFYVGTRASNDTVPGYAEDVGVSFSFMYDITE